MTETQATETRIWTEENQARFYAGKIWTEERQAQFYAMVDEEKGYRMERAKILTAEYGENEEQVIVDLLCLANSKDLSIFRMIERPLVHFHDESRDHNCQKDSEFAGRKCAEILIERFFETFVKWNCNLFGLNPSAYHERLRSRTDKAERAISSLMEGLSHSEAIGDSICDMLHFFVSQGKNPAELLCRAIEVFVFDVSQYLTPASKLLMPSEMSHELTEYFEDLDTQAHEKFRKSFDNLKTAIHEYIDSAMLIVEK